MSTIENLSHKEEMDRQRYDDTMGGANVYDEQHGLLDLDAIAERSQRFQDSKAHLLVDVDVDFIDEGYEEVDDEPHGGTHEGQADWRMTPKQRADGKKFFDARHSN